MIQLSIQYSLQKNQDSQCLKTQSVPSLVKAVIWESLYAICDSCHFCQTAGAPVLLTTTPPLESVAEVLEGLPWVTQDRNRKPSYWWLTQGLSCSLFFPTHSLLFSRWQSQQRSTSPHYCTSGVNTECFAKTSPTESWSYCITLLASSQPTWIILDEQFLSACPLSHSRV